MSAGFGSREEESSDEDDYFPTWTVENTAQGKSSELFEPYDRNQGYFLANLAKMLDEADEINLSLFLRWSPELPNALQINWPGFIQGYPTIHGVLVAYKMVRSSNSVVSARSSWNRKLREWKFCMKPPAADEKWTTYTYASAVFHRGCRYDSLPNKRRQN